LPAPPDLPERYSPWQTCYERGVTVEVLPSGQAVRRFGELDCTHATAALHLTC
jgi:hypothetical protein